MTAQRGKDLLLKIADGTGSYTTVAGLRAKRLALNTETVDVTDSESAGRWRELLAGAGVRRASLSGSGIFKDADSDERMRSLFFNGELIDCQIVVPDFGELSGSFQIVVLEYGAQHDGEITFETTLESASAIAFQAAA